MLGALLSTGVAEQTSDWLIAIAYFSIPIQLVYFLCKHPVYLDRRARLVVALFACFICLCGITHAFNAARMRLMVDYLRTHPNTSSDELLHATSAIHAWSIALLVSKIATAVVSVVTMLVLLFIIPQVLRVARYIPQLEEGLRLNIVQLNEARAAAESAMQRKSEFMAFLC